MFKSKDLFSPQQLLARAETRYCEDFSTPALRVKATPKMTMNDETIAWAAAALNITICADDGAAPSLDAGAGDKHVNDPAGPRLPDNIPPWLTKPADGQSGGNYQVVITMLTEHSKTVSQSPLRILAEWMAREGCYQISIEENCSGKELDEFLIRAGIPRYGGASGWKDEVLEKTYEWVDFLKAEADADHLARRQDDEPDAAGRGLSAAEVTSALAAEGLSFICSPRGQGTTGFQNVFLIKSGTHKGKFIAVGYTEDNDNFSLGIFHSSQEAALYFARFRANMKDAASPSGSDEEAVLLIDPDRAAADGAAPAAAAAAAADTAAAAAVAAATATDAGDRPAAVGLSYSLATSHPDVEEFISREWRASEVAAGQHDVRFLHKDFLPDCGGTKVLAESKSPKILMWLQNAAEGTRIGFAGATIEKGRRANFVRLERFYIVPDFRGTTFNVRPSHALLRQLVLEASATHQCTTIELGNAISQSKVHSRFIESLNCFTRDQVREHWSGTVNIHEQLLPQLDLQMDGAVNPNQLPAAPTNAAYGLAGLGVLGVDRVAAPPDGQVVGSGGNSSAPLQRIRLGDALEELQLNITLEASAAQAAGAAAQQSLHDQRAVNPNQLPAAPTNAAYGLAGLGVLGAERVAAAARQMGARAAQAAQLDATAATAAAAAPDAADDADADANAAAAGGDNGVVQQAAQFDLQFQQAAGYGSGGGSAFQQAFPMQAWRPAAQAGGSNYQERDAADADVDDEYSNGQVDGNEDNPDNGSDQGAEAAQPAAAAGKVVTGDAGRLPRNRDGQRKARSNKRGFVNVPRQEFRRLQGNKCALVNGNLRSCAQDALVNAAKALGVRVTKKQVYDATLPTEGDTEMGLIIDYAVNELGIQMDKKTQLCQIKGGPAYALLQKTQGVFVVELCISQSGMDDDYHNVVYDADYQHVMYPGIRGAIIDNEKDTPVKFIEPSDRAEVQQARDVFHSLFPFASNVRVVGAWLMRRIPSE